MLAMRIRAWDAVLRRGGLNTQVSVGPPPFHSCICAAASPKAPNFDKSDPKVVKQPYFKGKAANWSSSTSGGESRRATQSGANDELQRLAKVMAAAGVASRRACEELIEKGQVLVNGKVVNQQGTMVNPDKDVITVSGKKVSALKHKLYYFMVNKPKGYICSSTSTKEGQGKRAIDLMQPWLDEWQLKQKANKEKAALPPRFFTVGRLDVSTYGLLLVTNDGHWAQKVIHPSAELTKEYIVMVDKTVRHNHLDIIMAGAEVDGVHVSPEEVSVLEESTKIRIVVSEGKKHELSIRGRCSEDPQMPPLQQGGDDRSAYHLNKSGGDNSASVAPRISSSWFMVRDTHGRDIWMWDIAPWQRACAEAQLREDERATAPARYVDGRPKRKPKEGRIQDKGFAYPDSFPNAFTVEEWRALEAVPDPMQDPDQTWTVSDQDSWSLDPGHPKMAVSMGETSAVEGNGDVDVDCSLAVGLLDPCLFGSDGKLLGDREMESALRGLRQKEEQQQTELEQQQREQEEMQQKHQEHESASSLIDSFICQENWDWKVRILVANSGLEVVSLKRVRIGGLRIPPSLGLGGYKQMTAREIKAVTDQASQKQLRENAWASAAMLLTKESLNMNRK